MALNLPKIVLEFLRNRANEKFTARQIAEWIFETYRTECEEKRARSTAAKPLNTDKLLIQQLVAEIGSQRPQIQKKAPQIQTTSGRPRAYFYQTDTQANQKAEEPSEQANNELKEKDLYPLLSEYLLKELNVYSKRIDEKCSSNRRGVNGNKWLFPDLVGMEDLSADWETEIKSCAKLYGDKKTKLWSFEVKCEINRTNVREVYFQAVSNSSWANLGYLVAAEIREDTQKELRMLAGLHGIGVIQLDVDNITESQILIPAQERVDVDWNIANRLTEENKDFQTYIKLIRQFYQTDDPHKRDWDFCI